MPSHAKLPPPKYMALSASFPAYSQQTSKYNNKEPNIPTNKTSEKQHLDPCLNAVVIATITMSYIIGFGVGAFGIYTIKQNTGRDQSSSQDQFRSQAEHNYGIFLLALAILSCLFTIVGTTCAIKIMATTNATFFNPRGKKNLERNYTELAIQRYTR